jgi:hypothetical protein
MADNFAVTAGTGTTIASDDAAGVHYQKIKLIDSTADSTTATGVAANPLQVSLANTGANAAAVKVDGSAVTQPVSAASLPLPAGAATSAAQGTGNASLAVIEGAVAGTEMQVDVLTLPALPAGTNNIGDVDVLTLPAVTGGKSDNGGVPGATNLGTLPAVALAAAPTRTEGNQVGLRVNLAGDAAITLDGEAVVLGAGSANIGDVDVLTLPTLANVTTVATVTALTGGGIAHDAADSGNPHKIGARAVSSLEAQTAVAANDLTDLLADVDGVLIQKPCTTFGDILSDRVADTGGTSTAFTNLGAGGTGVRNYVTMIHCYNSSATPGFVDIRDGAAGAVLFTVGIPAGGGAVIPFPVPLRQPTTNTALAYDVSAALTTVYISVVGFQSKA